MHTSATTKQSTRRARDAYFTPEHATRELTSRVHLTGPIFEPCAGQNHIANALAQDTGLTVYTNDITDPATGYDVTRRESWQHFSEQFTIAWTITNPPFNQAPLILPLAHKYSRDGVAFLLRLSYLEPCDDRGPWLAEHPPTKEIVLPRISFTGDGKHDSVTCAWYVWRRHTGRLTGYDPPIVIVPKPPNEDRSLEGWSNIILGRKT